MVEKSTFRNPGRKSFRELVGTDSPNLRNIAWIEMFKVDTRLSSVTHISIDIVVHLCRGEIRTEAA
jgi:hypothetical protein